MIDSKRLIPDKSIPPWERLKLIMAILRSEDGCAWDRKQTHSSLLPYLVEETYEVVEAVESGDFGALREELGDLLCQIVFHAQLASEKGAFGADDAIESIIDKLIKRHPHVFGKRYDLNPQQVRDQWEKIKVESGEKKTLFSGLPDSMPALNMAFRIGEKAAGLGFDWKQPSDILDKLSEEFEEVKAEIQSGNKEYLTNEIGDLLFATASLARKLEVDPEQALKHALRKFKSRFGMLEEKICASGKTFQDFTLEQLEELWQKNKREISEPTDKSTGEE